MNGWKHCEAFLTFSACVSMDGSRAEGVSDDTGGVIPQTSVSNRQHEKDTLMTPYLPPTILYPPPPDPLLLPDAALSHLNPNQTVYQVTKIFCSTTSCNQRSFKIRSTYLLLCAFIHALINQEFHWLRNYNFSSCFFFFFWKNDQAAKELQKTQTNLFQFNAVYWNKSCTFVIKWKQVK